VDDASRPDDTDRPASGRPVRWLSFEMLLSVFNSIATIWIVVLMVVINIDIVGRTVFSAPLRGVPELVKLSIVGIIFLQVGHTLRAGRITRADGLIRPFERRWPRLGLLLQGLYSLCGVALFTILFYASRPLFVYAWTQSEFYGVEGYVTYPVWPVRLVILIGCACVAIQYALFAWQQLSAALTGDIDRGLPLGGHEPESVH
jgi:TRAP-type mannitol/chloroaromatic compound transport system permease small subunit